MKVRLDLTPHQRMALLTAVSDYMTRTDVSIDASTGEEIEIGSLLPLLMDAQPVIYEEIAEQLQTLEACLAAGWRLERDWEKIEARYRADLDLANTVPRAIIYYDLGVLIGTIRDLLAEKDGTYDKRSP